MSDILLTNVYVATSRRPTTEYPQTVVLTQVPRYELHKSRRCFERVHLFEPKPTPMRMRSMFLPANRHGMLRGRTSRKV